LLLGTHLQACPLPMPLCPVAAAQQRLPQPTSAAAGTCLQKRHESSWVFLEGDATIAATAQQIGPELQRATGKGQQANGNRQRATSTTPACCADMASYARCVFKCQETEQAGGCIFGSAKAASCFCIKPHDTKQELLLVLCITENHEISPKSDFAHHQHTCL